MGTNDVLLGELREFKRASLKRLDELEQKIDSLAKFKAKLLGGAALAALLATLAAELIRK